MRLWYYLFPIFVFLHIPLQTFFDFNTVFILLLVAKHPNPAAPGVAGSGRNWALGAAAYIASWVTQIFVVFIVYELVYSFVRRWRVKRPLVLPIYLSSPAFNLAAMTSYTNFCFLYHIRASAFLGEHGSLRDGLAETFYYYSQNLPTVALLLPRAGLSLALLLAFWSPQPDVLALADAGISPRDGTFFRKSDQTLTDYARGVLIANAAWSAWRILVLFVSWIGLWILSGQGCAGLCGPKYRWEEEDMEKTVTVSTDTFNEGDALPWAWREDTLLRVIDAYEFCLTNKHPRVGCTQKEGSQSEGGGFDGIEKVFAAIGIGSPQQQPARRGVLSGDLFESPAQVPEALDDTIRNAPNIEVPPPAVQGREKRTSAPSGPLQNLPYPFIGQKAQVSSEDVIPFPPSPEPEDDSHSPPSGDTTGDDDAGEEVFEEGPSGTIEDSEATSDERRTSGSMSSLGRPVVSRYPWQFRVPPSRGTSFSSHQSPRQAVSTPRSRNTTSSNSHSTPSQSTGNRESSDSPMSYPSSGVPSPVGLTGSVIPMPPRHPQGRSRARTVPSPGSASSGSPVAFPGWGRGRAQSGRTRTESDQSMSFGGMVPFVLDSDDDYEPNDDSLMDVPEAEGSIEEAEQHDSVGLLTSGSSPRASRTSLRQFASNLQQRSNRSRSRSGTSSASRSRTNSSNSREYARSRAQSLIQSLGAASRSSLELVRSRANSLARLSDSPYYSTSPDPMPSSPENNTFGHPIRQLPRVHTTARHRANDSHDSDAHDEDHDHDHDHDVSDTAELPSPVSPPRSRTSSAGDSFVGDATMTAVLPPVPASTLGERRRLTSNVSRLAPSEHYSVQTERPAAPGIPSPTFPAPVVESAPTQSEAAPTSDPAPSPVDQPANPTDLSARPQSPTAPVPIPGRVQPAESMPDISTANQSFVTAPATVQGTTESSGRTPSSWGTHYPPGQGGTWGPA